MFTIHLEDIVCGAYCHALERCEKEGVDSSKWHEARHLPMKVLDGYAHAVRQRLASTAGGAILLFDRNGTWDMVRSNTDIIDYDEWVAYNRIAIRDDVTAEQVAERFAGGIPTATIRALEYPSCVSIVDEWLDNDNKRLATPACKRSDDDGDDVDGKTDAAIDGNSTSDASPEQSDVESDTNFSPVTTRVISTNENDDGISIRHDDGGWVVRADSSSRPTVSIRFDDINDAGAAYMKALSSFVLGGASAFDAIADVISDIRETQE